MMMMIMMMIIIIIIMNVLRSRTSDGHVAHMGGRRIAYRVLVGRPNRKTPLGRTMRR
jgi:hypothetical protein